MIKVLTTAICLLIGLAGISQKLALKTGDKFGYDINENWSLAGKNNSKQTILDFEVLNKTDTDYILQGMIRKIVHEENIEWETFRINSENIYDATDAGLSTIFLPEIALLNQPFTIKVSENFTVNELSGVEAIIQKKMTEWEIKPEFTDQILQSGEGYLNAILGLCFFKLPDARQLIAGQSWEDSASRSRFKITKAGKSDYRVDISKRVQFETENDYTESNIINGKTNMLVSKEFLYKYQTHINGVVQDDKHTAQVKQIKPGQPIKANEKFWTIMAKGMFISNALETNDMPDSAKTLNYINQNDPFFAGYAPYVNIKLTVLQTIFNDNTDYQKSDYVKALAATPNYLLSGTYHLSSKLNLVDDADSIATILTLLNEQRVYGTVQDAFSQRLLDDNPRFSNARLGVDKAIAMGKENLKNALRPLTIWANVP